MRNLMKMPLDFPHVAHREPPIVGAEFIQARNSVAGDPSALVNVTIDIAHHQIAHRAKDWFAAVQPNVARAGHGTETPISLEQQQNMIQLVLRLDADEDRWKAVLFENDGSHERALQAMRVILSQHAAKRMAGRSFKLAVVADSPQEALDLFRRAMTLDGFPF